MSTTSIISTGRLLTYAALALGLMGLSPTVASAHDPKGTKTKPFVEDFQQEVLSPCTNELIDIQGRRVTRDKVEGSSPGKVHSIFTVDESGKGNGQITNDRYKYSNLVENEIRSSKCNFTMRFETQQKIIRIDCPEWRRDDFFLHHLVTVKGSGTGTNCGLNVVSRDILKKKCK